MKRGTRTERLIAVLLLIAMIFSGGCSAPWSSLPQGANKNEILTFSPNFEDKPIIRIGMQYYLPDDTLIMALQEEFPEYLFVKDYYAAAGVESEGVIKRFFDNGGSFDLLVSANYAIDKEEYLVDLSAQPFLNNYLLSSLNGVSYNGSIYAIPATSTVAGIAYNEDMFRQYGWEIPNDIEEFFSLCEEIQTEGIVPFSTCFKYTGQIQRVLGMMNYAELYRSPEDVEWMRAIQNNEAEYTGHMEPFYELAKRFYDTGVIPLDYFTASLTKQRQSFWAGECAMIDYDSVIYTYAESENATITTGFMPYPAKKSEDSGYELTPGYYFAIPKAVEQDPERLEFMLEVLEFISSPRGQAAMMEGSVLISNVAGVELDENNQLYKYVEEAYEKGNMYSVLGNQNSVVDFWSMQKDSVQTIFEGGSVEDALAMMDASIDEAFQQLGQETEEEYEVLTTAQDDFTILETSYYLADQLKAVTGADIGLVINRGYFRSNLATIEKGEVTANTKRFVQKGVGAEDYLTTYTLTGAQLMDLLEKPIVNGVEVDAMVAAAGLKIKYAPWNPRGSRVLSVSMEEGQDLVPDKLYTVAAYNGVIDEQYITQVVTVHDTAGTIEQIAEDSFRQAESIAPDIKRRVTLVWDK